MDEFWWGKGLLNRLSSWWWSGGKAWAIWCPQSVNYHALLCWYSEVRPGTLSLWSTLLTGLNVDTWKQSSNIEGFLLDVWSRTRDLFFKLNFAELLCKQPKEKMDKTTLALIDWRYLRNGTIWPSLWTPTDMSWFRSYQDHLMSSWIQGGSGCWEIRCHRQSDATGTSCLVLAASYGWLFCLDLFAILWPVPRYI